VRPKPARHQLPTRTHHGFTSHALRAPVRANGTQVWHGDSVSTSHEARDTHARICQHTWGIECARSRLAAGTPVILECYMHKLSLEERLEQLAWLI
jgi:hypothetical protein